METEIERIGVVGAGQMGHGIAQVAAISGYEVRLYDRDQKALKKAREAIDRSLEKLVGKEKIDPEVRDGALDRLDLAEELTEFSDTDLVVEAIVESEEAKVDLFTTLDDVVDDEAILTSNTSSISITRLAAATSRPDRFMGMHFMNPVPVMQLVELIEGLATSESTSRTVEAVTEKMGKTPVFSSDSPGFLVNRILMPMINEAIFAYHEGVGSAGDIDRAMKLGTNQPMGPLTLADFIGLDTCLSILEVLHDNLGDPKYRPCPLLRRYVDAGWLGKKSGRGFYTYD